MATCPKCRAHYADDHQYCEVDGELLLPDAVVQGFDGDLAEGDLVGEYRVEKKIGEGGFGKVYAAVHPVIGKRAAIKVLNREFSSNTSVVSRFVSEARAVNQIRHRNIIDIFSFGSLPGGLQYLVMELLEGETLDAYLSKHKRISPEQALPILHRIARALDAAHAAGIAHRDLKPENVFLCIDDDGGVYPKLLDFGIAKLMGDTNVHHKTRTGAAMGTPLYMSPEQCRGKGVDHRTDLYSFGVMIHEVLTGKLPFDGDSMMDLMFKHSKEPPPAMSSVCPDLPAGLDGPVLRMLEKSADDRPATVTEAVQALIDAAHTAGFDVSVKKSTTLGGVSGAGGRGLPSAAEAAPTVADTGPEAAAQTAGSHANTLQTVETVAKPGGQKTWLVAALALVVGVGATFALTRSDDEPRAGAPAASRDDPPAGVAPERSAVAPVAPTSSVTAVPPTTSAPSSSSAPPTPEPPKPVAAPPRPTPSPPSPSPPTTPSPSPLPKPPPRDLESPF